MDLNGNIMIDLKQIQERAEIAYPYHNDPASDPQQYLLRNAYIKGATEERELMSNQRVPISEYDGTKRDYVMRWHVMWKCPVCVCMGIGTMAGRWIEKTLTTYWPDEAFEPCFMPLPSSPVIKK
jgi:hypothetical protein